MLELVVFLLGSLGIIVLSRRFFNQPYSHGFPRFFAFEAILGLVVLNARKWLIQPLSMPQVVSWILLLAGTLLVSSSVWALHKYGAADSSMQDSGRLSFEKTTTLVNRGPYRLIRHPMYTSLLCLAWGVFLKQVNLLSALLAFLASLALFLMAVYEERENLQIFGEEYVVYMQHTKRFIPFLF